jgi:hypothetical protein
MANHPSFVGKSSTNAHLLEVFMKKTTTVGGVPALGVGRIA